MSEQKSPNCPQCEGPMVQRKNGKTQQSFWGCHNFPRCRGTRSMVGAYALAAQQQQNTFVPSDRQLAIREFILSVMGNLFVDAYAGTGKSTTVAWIFKQLPRHLQSIVYTFGKKPATELRVKHGVNASTMHSECFRYAQTYLGNLDVDGSKKQKNAAKYFPYHKAIRRFIVRVAGLAINTMTEHSDIEALKAMISHYGIEVDGTILEAKDDNDQPIPYDAILRTVSAVIIDGLEQIETEAVIDYDEMLYYGVQADLIPSRYDIVFVDEAQDTNALQIEFLKKVVKPTGRLVFVGDTNQAIYGFRGAMTDAVDRIVEAFNCERLPLDITYRCPKSHITELANPIVPQIVAAPNNIDGWIRDITSEQAMNEWKQMREALVLCRTNAPLVKQVLSLIKIGKKATIIGRNIAEGLISMIENFDVSTVSELLVKVDEYQQIEVARLVKKDEDTLAELLVDKLDCIRAVCDGKQLVLDVINKINDIFSSNRGGITFATVHAAKGMEDDNVFILEPGQLPFSSKTDWQEQQERNLAYVAFTRSKKAMTFVGGSPNWELLLTQTTTEVSLAYN